jgi:hypothetical protein
VKPLALFVVSSDPRVSARPVEAIRIAVGIAAWRRVDVAVYLAGAAALTIAQETDDLIEADNLERYAPLLRDLGRPVYVDSTAGFQRELSEAVVPFQPLSIGELAQLAGQSSCLLRF